MTAPKGFYRICDESFRHPGQMAKATGEFRAPRAGEWYLSGSIVEAYKAANDLSSPYHIARLVRVERVTVTRELQS